MTGYAGARQHDSHGKMRGTLYALGRTLEVVSVPGPTSASQKGMRALPELPGARKVIPAKLAKQLLPIRLILLLGTLMLGAACHSGQADARAPSGPPNILFIIMDDVGIDQLQAFNPLAPVRTPNIDTLVAH